MRAILLPVLCCLLLSSYAARGQDDPPRIDLAAEDLPFSIAPIDAPEFLPGAPALPARAQLDLGLRRAFFAGRYPALDRILSAARAEALESGESDHALQRFVAALGDTGLAGVNACRRWLDAMPDSYIAHLSCGAMWTAAAWSARSGETADKVTPARFALMRERLARANALLKKSLALTQRPVEALVMLASNHFAAGSRERAQDWLERAALLAPADAALHETRINFLLPEWGGSSKAVATAIARAAEAGVGADRLREFHDRFVAQPWRRSDPGAERNYWEAALADHPSRYRREGLARYFIRVENWRDGVAAASRLIEAHPSDAQGYWMRAVGRERLGQTEQARDDYRMAAALGHNLALQSLIQAHIQGGLGLPQRDWSTLYAVCRYGAVLGASAAANCLGAMFREGASVGAPVRTDIRQSLAWHLVAARGGYHNSQYDLGWLLMTGRVPGVERADGERLGLFWLRRAAELGHMYAKQKLRERKVPESEPVEQPASLWDRVTATVLPILFGR